MSIIAKELIGCRVYKKEDGSKEVIGKIVAFYTTSNYNHPYLGILTHNKEILEIGLFEIKIVEEDFIKVYNTIKPEPINDRFEIMDL